MLRYDLQGLDGQKFRWRREAFRAQVTHGDWKNLKQFAAVGDYCFFGDFSMVMNIWFKVQISKSMRITWTNSMALWLFYMIIYVGMFKSKI